jgi:hypothetical protein
MNKDEDENCTPDMYLASALISYGAKLTGVDRSNSKRLRFCFDMLVDHVFTLEAGQEVRKIPNPSFKVIKNEFTSKTLMLPPSYPDAIRSIKSAIHEDE